MDPAKSDPLRVPQTNNGDQSHVNSDSKGVSKESDNNLSRIINNMFESPPFESTPSSQGGPIGEQHPHITDKTGNEAITKTTREVVKKLANNPDLTSFLGEIKNNPNEALKPADMEAFAKIMKTVEQSKQEISGSILSRISNSFAQFKGTSTTANLDKDCQNIYNQLDPDKKKMIQSLLKPEDVFEVKSFKLQNGDVYKGHIQNGQEYPKPLINGKPEDRSLLASESKNRPLVASESKILGLKKPDPDIVKSRIFDDDLVRMRHNPRSELPLLAEFLIMVENRTGTSDSQETNDTRYLRQICDSCKELLYNEDHVKKDNQTENLENLINCLKDTKKNGYKVESLEIPGRKEPFTGLIHNDNGKIVYTDRIVLTDKTIQEAEMHNGKIMDGPGMNKAPGEDYFTKGTFKDGIFTPLPPTSM